MKFCARIINKKGLTKVSIQLIRKSFLPFRLYSTYPIEKCNHKKSYAYLSDSQYSHLLIEEMLSPRPFVIEWTSLDLQKVNNISNKLSDINDNFKIPTCFIDEHYT